MTPAETATILRQFNERCQDCQFEDQYRVMDAIDAAIEMIERYAKTELEIHDRNDLIARLQNELRGYREREKTMGWQT